MMTWSDIQRATNAEIVEWAGAEPWARDMSRCRLDRESHGGGTVWSHTKLVCAELEQLQEWPALSRSVQLTLLLAGLFHDAGKPATAERDPESGRMRFPKHSLAGAHLARQTLRELECDLRTREEIVALVRSHSKPSRLLEQENPEQQIIATSWLVNNRLLYLFSLADARGRVMPQTSKEENLQLWKMLAEENNCFNQPYPFANDHARFLFYRGELSSLHYTPHEAYRCKATLMAGLPASGKANWLMTYRPDLPVVSLETVRAELDIDVTDNQGTVIQAAREQCREHLRHGRDFAFHATNATRLTRKRWIDLFADYGARIEIIYIEPPMRVVREQNQLRAEPVPDSVMGHLAEKLDPPTIAEAHELNLLEA